VIRVLLPAHLKALAKVDGEVQVDAEPTVDAVLTAVEERYPMLGGTIRDRGTGKRRAYVRYYACELDLSHDPTDQPLPDEVAEGKEPLIVLGAMSGG
jgi:molybdopterin converting factor small subunit